MREIKYRVWNKRINQLFICDDIYFALEPLNEAFKLNEFAFMQYTGLKDANGKEIYEGDILQWSDGDMTIGVVEWLEGDTCFDIDFLNLGGFKTKPTLNGFSVDKVKGYKVIGNIYENSELLGDKTNE